MSVLTMIECDKCKKRLENKKYKFMPFKDMVSWAADEHRWYTTKKQAYGKFYNFCPDCIELRHEFRSFEDFLYSVNLEDVINTNKRLMEDENGEYAETLGETIRTLERKLNELLQGSRRARSSYIPYS